MYAHGHPVSTGKLPAMTELVSGASGFIGGRLCAALAQEGRPVRTLSRHGTASDRHAVAELSDVGALESACAGIDRVFHCAGYTHAFASLGEDDAKKHWAINFQGSRNLAVAAGRAGVRRFVFLSSVKAMAEPGVACADETFPGQPATAYGRAKRAAEEALLEAGERYGMQVVNLRLTMVYGAGGRGNLERMARLVKSGLFPPLPESRNHRSLVHVDDAVRALKLAATSPQAAGRTYIITHPHAPSGRELYDALRAACGLPAMHLSIPAWGLEAAAQLGNLLERFLGRRLPLDREALDRLLGSAWYSPDRIERELGWRAEVSLEKGLIEMLRHETAL